MYRRLFRLLPTINGKTWAISCLMFFCKLKEHVFTYNDIEICLPDSSDEDIPSALQKKLRSMGDIKKISNKKSNLEADKKLYFAFFAALGNVFKYAQKDAKNRTGNKNLTASDFMKSDANYCRDVIPRLWEEYNEDDGDNKLKKAVTGIFGKL